MAVRIGELLLKEKRITPAQLQEALNYQKTSGGKLGYNLVKLGFVKDEELTALLSKQYGVPSINLAQFEVDPGVIKLIPAETAHKYQIVPLSRSGATLTIAMTDPTNVFAMDDIKFMTGYNIEPVVASEAAILDGIEKAYKNSSAEQDLEAVMASIGDEGAELEVQDEDGELALADLEKAAEEAPIVKLVNIVLTDALKRGASDIHLEPYEKEYRVRFRIDGVLQTIMTPPMKLKDAITSRIKIM